MGKVTTDDPDVKDFIESLQAWHENKVDQLKLVVDNVDAAIDIEGKEIPADDPVALGIRLGVSVALSQLGKLPFTVTENQSQEDEDDDWED